mgnify:CR=1 FL=1
MKSPEQEEEGNIPKQESDEKEIPASEPQSSRNKTELAKSQECLQPERPAENLDSTKKLRPSRTLKTKRSDTVNIPSDVAKERSTKRKSFTNVGGRPMSGSTAGLIVPKSQYSKSNRTDRNPAESERNNENGPKSARDVAKSQASENEENNKEDEGSKHELENKEGSRLGESKINLAALDGEQS